MTGKAKRITAKQILGLAKEEIATPLLSHDKTKRTQAIDLMVDGAGVGLLILAASKIIDQTPIHGAELLSAPLIIGAANAMAPLYERFRTRMEDINPQRPLTNRKAAGLAVAVSSAAILTAAAMPLLPTIALTGIATTFFLMGASSEKLNIKWEKNSKEPELKIVPTP